MFRSYYAVTKDRKGGVHQYRLTPGEGVPRGEEIVDLRVAGQFALTEFLPNSTLEKMNRIAAEAPAATTKKARRKRATKE